MGAGLNRTPEVVIVGGGPVGLLLGCLLAERDVDVAVFERGARPSHSSRAIGIHAPGLAALDAAGVGRNIREAAAPVRVGIATNARRELGRLVFAEPILTLPQHRTEAVLEARLALLAPGALRRDARVVALRETGQCVELEVIDGGIRRDVTTRYVAGADGIRSTVRPAIGASWRARRGSASYVMADVARSPEPPEAAVLRLGAAGVVESFPLPGGGRRWVARVDGTAPADARAFAALLQDRAGVAVAEPLLSGLSAFTARQHLAEPFTRGRIALVGDAAHEVSPIGGQGMNLGMIDARNLAQTIAGALASGAPDAPFGAYARSRRASAIRAMRQAAFNMAMGAPLSPLSQRARDAFALMLLGPLLRDALTGSFTMRGL